MIVAAVGIIETFPHLSPFSPSIHSLVHPLSVDTPYITGASGSSDAADYSIEFGHCLLAFLDSLLTLSLGDLEFLLEFTNITLLVLFAIV